MHIMLKLLEELCFMTLNCIGNIVLTMTLKYLTDMQHA